MGRALLVCRLAVRDLRRRRAETVLLLLAITAATTVLTLGLVLRGVTSEPYQRTREATAGPDVVASVAPPRVGSAPTDLGGLEALIDAPGVVGHSGPFPIAGAVVEAHGRTAAVQAEGRDTVPASVDQPQLTRGSWISDGGVVVEAAFADALGVGVGDPITLNGRSFQVVGVAVTAAMVPYPHVCFAPCWFGVASEAAADQLGDDMLEAPVGAVPSQPPPRDPGLVWLTQADVRSLAPAPEALTYVVNLKLSDPDAAPEFVRAHSGGNVDDPLSDSVPFLVSSQDILEQTANLVRNQQRTLVVGGWLLGVLAVASVAVLVGGRIADQIRRVGLLKAVGGTPGLVAVVLLAEYVLVAMLAAAAGLAVGWLAAPLLTDPSAGVLGSAGPPPLTVSTIGLVTAVALAVATAASLGPAVRASRTSTVRALADSARPPRRAPWLIAISARLPVPLLLGLRVAARRPRRVVLGVVSIAITVSGIVAALSAHTQLGAQELGRTLGLDDPRTERLNQVLLVVTITLVALAAVNAIFITWATALDARHASALARALGATPNEVSVGLSAAQMLPALAGAVAGIPGGIALFGAMSDDGATIPPLWQLLAVVPTTALVLAALTTIPARVGARRPVVEILQSELA